jgi:hypothetical protein
MVAFAIDYLCLYKEKEGPICLNTSFVLLSFCHHLSASRAREAMGDKKEKKEKKSKKSIGGDEAPESPAGGGEPRAVHVSIIARPLADEKLSKKVCSNIVLL